MHWSHQILQFMGVPKFLLSTLSRARLRRGDLGSSSRIIARQSDGPDCIKDPAKKPELQRNPPNDCFPHSLVASPALLDHGVRFLCQIVLPGNPVFICDNMPTIPSIGGHGARRLSPRPKEAANLCLFPSGTPPATGVMSWPTNASRTRISRA